MKVKDQLILEEKGDAVFKYLGKVFLKLKLPPEHASSILYYCLKRMHETIIRKKLKVDRKWLISQMDDYIKFIYEKFLSKSEKSLEEKKKENIIPEYFG